MQLAALGLVDQAPLQAVPHREQLELAHRPLQSQQQAVVAVRRVVDAVLVAQEGAEQGAQLQQVVPVLGGPGQPAHLQAQDQADVPERHLGEQPLEPGPVFGPPAALALVLVDDHDPGARPAQGDGVVGQGVLPGLRLGVLQDLLRGGLPDVHDGRPVQVTRQDLRRANRADRRLGGGSRFGRRGRGRPFVATHDPPPLGAAAAGPVGRSG